MSVLIKRMEMPKNCDKCELMTANYGCAFVGAVGGESYRKRAWDCPLVEVPEQMKWIPVTERLPDAGKKVLVFAYGYDTITARMCKKTESGYPVFECKGYNGIYREIARTGRISHWMPLPQPPEKEKT